MSARRMSPLLAMAFVASALAGIDLPYPPVLPSRRRREDPPREPPPDPSPIRGERAHLVVVDEMQDPAWRELPVPSAPPGFFHAHLDHCAQCRDNPFGLCEAGARVPEAEASTGVTLDGYFAKQPTPSQAAAMARTSARIDAGDPGIPNATIHASHRALAAAEAKRDRKRAARLHLAKETVRDLHGADGPDEVTVGVDLAVPGSGATVFRYADGTVIVMPDGDSITAAHATEEASK